MPRPSCDKLWKALSRGVAQSGSALQWGCRGRRFESFRPDQLNQGFTVFSVNPFFMVFLEISTKIPLIHQTVIFSSQRLRILRAGQLEHKGKQARTNLSFYEVLSGNLTTQKIAPRRGLDPARGCH